MLRPSAAGAQRGEGLDLPRVSQKGVMRNPVISEIGRKGKGVGQLHNHLSLLLPDWETAC